MADQKLLHRFEQLKIPAPEFRHRDHVQVAFEMLDEYEFVEGCLRYAKTIRTMAESVGALDKFNTTITVAFISLIAERKSQAPGDSFEDFLAKNDDLMDRNVLQNWYSKERLASDSARTHFLMPDKKMAG